MCRLRENAPLNRMRSTRSGKQLAVLPPSRTRESTIAPAKAAFDPVCFWTELPQDLVRKILSCITTERQTAPKIRDDHSDIDRIVDVFERDLRMLGVLRLTNKEQPFRLELPENRALYYTCAMQLWRLRHLRAFRRKLQDMPSMTPTDRGFAYRQLWFALLAGEEAALTAADKDPDALKRALRAIRKRAEANVELGLYPALAS